MIAALDIQDCQDFNARNEIEIFSVDTVKGCEFQNEAFKRRFLFAVYCKRCVWISGKVSSQSLFRIFSTVSCFMQCSKTRLSKSCFTLLKANISFGNLVEEPKNRAEGEFVFEFGDRSIVIAFLGISVLSAFQYFFRKINRVFLYKGINLNWNQDIRSQIYFGGELWFWKQRWIKQRCTFWKFRIDSNLRQGS